MAITSGCTRSTTLLTHGARASKVDTGTLAGDEEEVVEVEVEEVVEEDEWVDEKGRDPREVQ